MITFFQKGKEFIYAVECDHTLSVQEVKQLEWLLDGQHLESQSLHGNFVGPRKEMVTPWSTNAVEITQNMSMRGVSRIEEFSITDGEPVYDKMLQRHYVKLDKNVFHVTHQPEPIVYIRDLESYN